MAQIITPQLCIFNYIYVVELKVGPRFGHFQVKIGPSYKFKLVQVFIVSPDL